MNVPDCLRRAKQFHGDRVAIDHGGQDGGENTPEPEAQLSQIANHAGTDAEHLVKEAALRVVEEKNRFRAAVREGIAQADRGELTDDDDVRLWLERHR